MKNLTSLRNTLAAALIISSMISCTKENIEPTNTNTFDNARHRTLTTNTSSVSSFDQNTVLTANQNDVEMLVIQTIATSTQAAMRIAISENAIASIMTDNDSRAFRLTAVEYDQILNMIATFDSNEQEFSPNSNSHTASRNQIAFRTCRTCEIAKKTLRSDVMRITNSNELISEMNRLFNN